MRTIEQTLQAGVEVQYHAPGTFFRLLETSAALSLVFYLNGKEVARADNIEGGYAEEMAEGFDKITLKSATTQAVKFVFRQGGTVAYDRMAGNVGMKGGNVSQAVAIVTNASAQLLAANAARRFLMIQNKHASGNLFINLAGVAATTANGIKLPPDGVLLLDVFPPGAAVFAIGDIASNPDVLVLEG